MAIKEGDFVKLSDTGSANGIVFDTTDEDAAKSADIHSTTAIYGPVTICVGQKHVISGLDEELVGKDAGDEVDVTVPPEKAFGERDPKKIQSFQKNKFKDKPVRGMRINVEEQGEGTVVDVIGSRVVVDFNPVLAGQTLSYHYKIEETVTDPLEEFRGLIRSMPEKTWRSPLTMKRQWLPFRPESPMTGAGFCGGAVLSMKALN